MGSPEDPLETHIPALTRYARSLTRDRDQAEDLVQDTVLRYLARHGQSPMPGNLAAYLTTMLRNIFIDGRRRHKRFADAVPAEDVALASDDAPQRLRLAAREVVDAVAELPADAADVLMRHARDDQSYTEIAADLGVPVGTVMSRMNRARGALRKALGDDSRMVPAWMIADPCPGCHGRNT